MKAAMRTWLGFGLQGDRYCESQLAVLRGNWSGLDFESSGSDEKTRQSIFVVREGFTYSSYSSKNPSNPSNPSSHILAWSLRWSLARRSKSWKDKGSRRDS